MRKLSGLIRQVHTLMRYQRMHLKNIKSAMADMEEIDQRICELEEDIYWIHFIDYCNTSSWRFTC